VILELKRDGYVHPNLGKLFVDGKLLGQTLEDQDRHLEAGGEKKIYGETAIPRGQYRVQLSYSQRFKRIMPEVLDVPGFTGIRLHGGNTEEDTDGCPLLGAVRTASGVAQCGGVNQRLINILEAAEIRGEDIYLEVT
jgi:hypothetical protein